MRRTRIAIPKTKEMTNETEADTKEKKAEDHNSRSDVSTGNIPAIKELPNSLKETLDDKKSIIGQNKSPLYTNGSASRTAMTSLMIT